VCRGAHRFEQRRVTRNECIVEHDGTGRGRAGLGAVDHYRRTAADSGSRAATIEQSSSVELSAGHD
jgi:hypothetical protein